MKIFFLVINIFLLSCYTQSFSPRHKILIPDQLLISIYWEWGGILTQQNNLYYRTNSSTVIFDSLYRITYDDENYSDYCIGSSYFEKRGERFFSKKDSMVYLECVFSMRRRHHYDYELMNGFLRGYLDRPTLTFVKNNNYHIYYFGDSLHINSGNFIKHNKIIKKSVNEVKKIYEISEHYWDFSESIYEIVFDMNSAMHTFSIDKNHKVLSAYSPLKLDPSLLPLESPGYKALREQEEAMNKE